MPSKLNIEIHRTVAVKSDFSGWDRTVCGPVSYTHLDVYKRQGARTGS